MIGDRTGDDRGFHAPGRRGCEFYTSLTADMIDVRLPAVGAGGPPKEEVQEIITTVPTG